MPTEKWGCGLDERLMRESVMRTLKGIFAGSVETENHPVMGA